MLKKSEIVAGTIVKFSPRWLEERGFAKEAQERKDRGVIVEVKQAMGKHFYIKVLWNDAEVKGCLSCNVTSCKG